MNPCPKCQSPNVVLGEFIAFCVSCGHIQVVVPPKVQPDAEPPTLGVSVREGIKTKEKFG